jgi:hypothetical protein
MSTSTGKGPAVAFFKARDWLLTRLGPGPPTRAAIPARQAEIASASNAEIASASNAEIPTADVPPAPKATHHV